MRILDRKRAQEDGIEEAENGGVGADSESERRQRDDGECRTAKQGTRAVGDVGQEAFQSFGSPDHKALLLDASGVAELELSGARGGSRRQAAIHLLPGPQFEMEPHFFLQIALQLVAMEKHLDAALDFARQAHTLLLCRLDNLGDCAHNALELA